MKPDKVVKRAFSLPKSLDERLHGLASDRGLSYSGILREAIELYLGARGSKAMEDAYARYYSDPKNVKNDQALAAELWEFVKRSSP